VQAYPIDNLDFNETRHDEVARHVITTPAPHHLIFTGWMLFLMANERCQSTEGMQHTEAKLATKLSDTVYVQHHD